MPEIKGTKTVTSRTELDLGPEELEALLRDHFSLPKDAGFSWRINRYEEFDGVSITHETKEVTSG
jgi:hypothetical protein